MTFRGGKVALVHRVEFPGGLPFRGTRCKFASDRSHPQLTSAGRKLITGNLDVNNFAEIISSRGWRLQLSAHPDRRRRNSARATAADSPSRKSALKKPCKCFAKRSRADSIAPSGREEGVPRARREPEKNFLRHCGERRFFVPKTGKCANSGRTLRSLDGFAARKKRRPHKAAGTGKTLRRTSAQWPSSSSSWA